MNNTLKAVLVCLMVISSLSSFSQKMLLAKKAGSKHNDKFYVGSEIFFKYCDGDCIKYKGTITNIEEGAISVNRHTFEIEKINTIYVERKMLKYSQYVVGGGSALYLGLSGVNALISKDKVQLGVADYAVPLSLMAVTIATIPLNMKKYDLCKPKKYNLQVLDFNM